MLAQRGEGAKAHWVDATVVGVDGEGDAATYEVAFKKVDKEKGKVRGALRRKAPLESGGDGDDKGATSQPKAEKGDSAAAESDGEGERAKARRAEVPLERIRWMYFVDDLGWYAYSAETSNTIEHASRAGFHGFGRTLLRLSFSLVYIS